MHTAKQIEQAKKKQFSDIHQQRSIGIGYFCCFKLKQYTQSWQAGEETNRQTG
jgi:hypothetical protein